MGSSIVCACGAHIRKNLFSGHNLCLLVAEERLDRDFSAESAEHLVQQIVLTSPVVVVCVACDRLHVLDESRSKAPRVYVLEVDSETRY